MARTKASVGSKVSSVKSSKARCSVAPAVSNSFGSSGSERQSKGASGGNPVCPRETPKWQKPITNFFICKDGGTNNVDTENMEAGTSNMKSKNSEIECKNGNISLESDNESNAPETDNENAPAIDTGNNAPAIDNGNNAPAIDNGNNSQEIEVPKNRELDESIELHPLNGENSHKIEEYYNKGNKGKGVGKKTKGKENRRDNKRSREDNEESVSKKVKVDE